MALAATSSLPALKAARRLQQPPVARPQLQRARRRRGLGDGRRHQHVVVVKEAPYRTRRILQRAHAADIVRAADAAADHAQRPSDQLEVAALGLAPCRLSDLGDIVRHLPGEHEDKGDGQRLGIDLGRRLLNRVAQGLEQAQRILEPARTLRMEVYRRADQGLAGIGNPQRPGCTGYFVQERTLYRGRRIRCAAVCACRGVERGRTVTHRPGQHVLDHQPFP